MKEIATTGRPHLLYIAFAFPPSTASSVYRCVAVPNQFAAAGWDVTVLTIHGDIWSEVSGRDDELLRSVHERIRIVRISDGGSEEPGRGNLRRFSRLRVDAPFVWSRLLELRSRRHFPERFHGLWLPEAIMAAKEIHTSHTVDLTMASAAPYVGFEVARSLEGVPYVLDYRDAWAFNTISGKESFTPKSRNGRLESSLLLGAEQIWFVNNRILEEYARRYPSARNMMRVVPNGFDMQPGHSKPRVEPVEKPTFGYLGTIPHVNSPIEILFAGWRRAFGVFEDVSEPAARAVIRGKLSSSGRVSTHVLESFKDMRPHGLQYDGPISKRQVANFYQSLDALILLLAGGRYVTGGKTAEYLATGLPIVSVHELSNAATDLLKDYPLWFPAQSLTEDGIARALGAAAEYLKCPDHERASAAWEYGQQFLRSRMLEPVIAELAETVNSGAGLKSQLVAMPGNVPSVDAGEQSKIEEPLAGNRNRRLRVGVISADRQTAPGIIEHLGQRLAGVTHSSPDVWSAYPQATVDSSVALPVVSLSPSAQAVLKPIISAPGLVGIMGRLIERGLLARRFARAVLRNGEVQASIESSDIVVAGDEIAIRAVWKLRTRSNAQLVYGPAALIHACHKASGPAT
ncbi:glycosyltransferase [Arthrobacter sp. EH-1B-1]|uniref:Glycosyltransferase n=1 Tax=Arthrobacter vasquezii TaxID=2977629 RepID=A0ABT6CTM1_9MICC|nr:glycosyltransferase [Arthrobacter vasquezii]MDF9277374.1 glycosyltransferase [Arthrobacter vasquezii]